MSRAVVADTRGAAPFRLQQIVFDTTGGVCVDRELYLLADSAPDLHGDRIHRAIQPLTACASIEHAWPDGQRQFDLATLAHLLSDADTALGPPLELASPLMPRARMVSRGRRGLVRANHDHQTVIEIMFQRCELATASQRRLAYYLSLNLLAGDIRALYSDAWQWQQRFSLVLDPQAFFVHAARLAAGKPSRPARFSAPVWLPGRSLPETASYPAVSGSLLLVSAASDLALQVCAIAEAEASGRAVDLQRLEAFEQDVQAADCLLHFLRERSGTSLPAEITEPLNQIQTGRYEHLVQSRLTHWAREAGLASISEDARVRKALGVRSAGALRTLVSDALTRQWVLALLAWCESRDGANTRATATPTEVQQEADRQQLEQWVQRIQASVTPAQEPEFDVRLQLWKRLHLLDEALTQFSAALPRRLLLRYRMNIRATLVPLTDWLVLTRLLGQLLSLNCADNQLVKRPEWPQEQAKLKASWEQELPLAEQRVVSQLSRLAQTATPDDPHPMPAL